MQAALPYQQILDSVRRLSPGEQLALVSDIVTELRASYAEDDLAEANILAESPVFYRLIERGLNEIATEQARPVGDLLDEL